MKITIEIEVEPDGIIPPLDELKEMFEQDGIDTLSGYLGSEFYDQTSNWGLDVKTTTYTIQN